MPLEIALIHDDDGWPDGLGPLAERGVFAALAASKSRLKGAAEISIVLSNDAEQRQLNKRWRDKDASTNVLSFAQIEPFGAVVGILGDIVLARETLEREAEEQGISFSHHFTHLIVHGFLHILGYDHLNDEEALEMEGLETKILAGLGISDPYADHT
ncbi:rRNA maturation RNase YbeY [Devosia rhodophyticola]|uniref:rRNA maturation RNase YbeY n=1 Tax=Devosia rhodophyticola TaxID=3026423 RepID=UPI0038996058